MRKFFVPSTTQLLHTLCWFFSLSSLFSAWFDDYFSSIHFIPQFGSKIKRKTHCGVWRHHNLISNVKTGKRELKKRKSSKNFSNCKNRSATINKMQYLKWQIIIQNVENEFEKELKMFAIQWKIRIGIDITNYLCPIEMSQMITNW